MKFEFVVRIDLFVVVGEVWIFVVFLWIIFGEVFGYG